MTTTDKEYKQEKRSSLRDLAYVFFRRKWVIIGVFLSTVIPVTVYTLQIPLTYQAKSRLLVKPGRENIYVSPVGSPEGGNPPIIVQRVGELISTEIQILKSRVLMERVVKEMGIATLFSHMLPEDSRAVHAKESLPVEVAVNRALSNLSARRIKGTDVIEVAFRSHDPDIPGKFVTTLVDRYLERHLEVHQSGKSYDFFKAQSDQLEQKLKTAARKLADFRKKYSIISFNQRKTATLDRYMAVRASKRGTDTAIKVTQKRIDEFKEELAKIPDDRYLSRSEASDSSLTSSLKQRLAQLELDKLNFMTKYKPDHRLVRIDKTIAKIKEMLAEEEKKFHGSVQTGASTTYRRIEDRILDLEVDLEALHRKGVELEAELIEYGQELERLGRLEPQLRALERVVSVNEQNYKLYLTKFEESRVRDAMDAAEMVSVSVIEPATAPLGPIPVSKRLNIFVSMCIGCVAGLGLAFLIEYFDHTFKLSEDIKNNLKVPLLGTIEDIPDEEREDLGALAITPKPPPNYEILKSNIVMHAEDKGIKTLSICSPTAKEGASTVALNLAVAIAKDNGGRVVLVDANLRHPFLHTSFNLPATPGFSDVIHEGTNVHEAIKESVIPNLFVLTSGISPPNPMVVFESPKLVGLIEVLRREFDWIVFDCAPINVYPDSTVLVARLDGVVLVIEAENKRAEVAIRAKEYLEQAGAKLLGAVLNRRRHVIPEIVYRRL